MTDLDEIQRALAEATPGKWKWHWREDDDSAPGSVYAEDNYAAWAIAMCPRYRTDWKRDAHLIANAPTWLAELVEEVERLRMERAAFEGRMVEAENEVRRLAKLLDEAYGTPCEQVRHEQEVGELKAEIERLERRAP